MQSHPKREKRSTTGVIKKYTTFSKRETLSPPAKGRVQYNINRKLKKKNRIKITPKINHYFTEEEDHKIISLVQEMGPKFVQIATHFPNKSYSMIKNRYYKHLRDQPLLKFTKIEEQKKDDKVKELDQLISSINFSPEITQLTHDFIHKLQQQCQT